MGGEAPVGSGASGGRGWGPAALSMASAGPADSRPQPCSGTGLALVQEADSARKEPAKLGARGRHCLGRPPKGWLPGRGGGGGREVAEVEGAHSSEGQSALSSRIWSPMRES